MIDRLLLFIREVAVGYQGKNVLVVSHAGVIYNLLVHLGYIERKEKIRTHIHNTAYVKIRSDGVDFFIDETYGVGKHHP